MKPRLTRLAVLVAGMMAAPGSVLAQGAAVPQPLTLDQAIRIALRSNPASALAQQQVSRARARSNEAAARQGPQVTGASTYAVAGPVPFITFPDPRTGKPTPVALIVPSSISARLSLAQDLDVWGRLRGAHSIARRAVDTARYQQLQEQRDLVLTVETAFFEVLRAQEAVRVSQDAITAAQERLRVAQAGYRAGTAPEFDVLQASVRVANLQQSLVSAQNGVRLQAAALDNQLGLDANTPLILAPVALPPAPSLNLPVAAPGSPPGMAAAPDGAPTPAVPSAPAMAPRAPLAPGRVAPPATSRPPSLGGAPPGVPRPPTVPSQMPAPPGPHALPPPGPAPITDFHAALRAAYANRPELAVADENVLSARTAVHDAQTARLPALNFGANYNYTPNTIIFNPVVHSWNFNVTAVMGLWDSGLARSRVREAKADLATARSTREQIRQAIVLDVQDALVNLQEAAERRRTAAANTAQAREALRIAQVRYRAGVSTTAEMTDAESELTQAETNQVDADYDDLTAEARLNHATGTIWHGSAASTPDR